MPPTPSDRHATGRIRQEMAAFNFRAQQWRLALKLKANFDPNQPRVPAGNPDGGQWTGDGSSTGRGGSTGRRAAPKTVTGTSQRVVRDESGREAWHSIVRTESTGGKLAEQTVHNRDGSTVRSVYPAKPGDGDRREGHLVRLPDGTARIFLSDGLTQSIFDGKGQLLSRSIWTENGPQDLPIVEPVGSDVSLGDAGLGGIWNNPNNYFENPKIPLQAANPLLPKTTAAGLALFGALSAAEYSEAVRPVIAFKAKEFQPNAGAKPRQVPAVAFVGDLSRDEVDAACPRLEEVQARTDRAVAEVKAKYGDSLSPQAFGTAVHMNLKEQVRSLRDPKFRAEVSALKSLNETYGTKNSVRIDVFEEVGNGTVCVYDIKTGKAGFGPRRMREIALKVSRSYGPGKRFIIIEIRPIG